MRIIELSTRRRVTIAMFTLAVVIFGAVSYGRLKINLLPDLSYPTLTVRTEYAGAAPVEVENLVTKPVEEALGAVKNVEQLESISRTGQSDVVLEFAWGTDMDYASLDVREKLDALSLPLDSDRPILLRFDPSLEPVMRFGLSFTADDDVPAVAGSGESGVRPVALAQADEGIDEEALRRLRRFADEEIKKELESALGVAAVKISGGLEEEIHVLVDQDKVAQLRLPLERIAQVLGAENVNLSGGRLEEGSQQFLVRTVNQFETVEEIGDVIVMQRGATAETAGRPPVYLRDIATVRLGHKERTAITRIDGTEAVELAIYKEGDANTVTVARAVEARLERVRDILPEGVELVKVYDQSTFITQAVNEVVNAGLIGGVLAILILYFFLRSIGPTLIVSLSIPVSVIATFNLMYWNDITLNIMSLGGLALGIGLLLDNSIVVLENIARHRALGEEHVAAATKGASEVGRAVIASTLTTVAVFFPLVFVKGIAGQLFRDQALTVTFSLLASLVVAITLIPMLATFSGKKRDIGVEAKEVKSRKTRFGRGARKATDFVLNTVPTFITRVVLIVATMIGRLMRLLLAPFVIVFNKLYDALEGRYPSVISWSLDHRALVLVVAFTAFGLSLTLIPRLGVELIPQLVQGQFEVEFRLPPGTPLEQTDGVIREVQLAARTSGDVSTTFAVAGSGNRLDANPEEGGENWGELSVAMKSGSGRSEEQAAMAVLRREMVRKPGLQYKISRPTLFSFQTPIEIEVSGYEIQDLKRVSQSVVERLEASDRFTDVKSTVERGQPEVRIIFDRERAAALGLAVHELAQQVVDQVKGDVATRYSRRDRKIDVLVRAREEDRASIDHIRRLVVNPQSPRPVTLSSVAEIVVEEGPGEIRRLDQQRVAIVSANLGRGDLGGATEEINAILDDVRLPPGIGVRLAGQTEEMAVSFRSLVYALLLAIFLVYLVMASQFESLIHPFVIFFTIPLALIGAILALWLTGSAVSVVVFIGCILLVGIVVNNAIVLVDLINQLRDAGMERRQAIVEGGRLRLRPILMTTLTTTLGLLPLAIGFGEGAELRAPMGITVIGGLVISTMLTLVIIPVMYSLLDRQKPSPPSQPVAS